MLPNSHPYGLVVAQHPMMSRFRSLLCLLAGVATGWASLALPARAQNDFLTDLLLPESQERALAEQEHPKVLAQFGGEYRDPELLRYVQGLTEFLGRTSARPDLQYRVTILNSPVVNAFALPAGYVYVTRGLLALADSEAELAGVLAHEIGHVTARHTAQRYSRTLLAQGILGLLGQATQGTQLGGLAEIAAPAALIALQGFSREHEHEADLLGVQTMARAGFDPNAMASFLDKLQAKTALDSRLAGQAASSGGGFDLFSTHPRTPERVARTAAQAGATQVFDPMVERELYLRKIDGLLYGDDPEQGFVRGQVFAHPALGFRFEVPRGFSLLNGQKQVIARGPSGAVIRFDAASGQGLGSALQYLRNVWGKDMGLQGLERLNINGFPGATGSLRFDNQGELVDLRLVAIEAARNQIYRFMFAAPAAIAGDLRDDFQRTTFSFRRLSRDDRQRLRPFRLITYQVRPGDSVSSLAQRLPFAQSREERFRVLNGLAPGQPLQVGQMVKLVTEQ